VLNQDQRDVLALRVVAGLSVEQTAKVKKCGIDTVKLLQRKAMAKVRVIMPPEVVTR
jgi:RNA polymerase sigma-70 factor (ECF subfamily)